MFYKLALLNSNLSYSIIIKNLSYISKFFIIITPTISINYYIIYIIIDNKHLFNKQLLNELLDLKKLIIYNFSYNSIIYKLFRIYLTWNNNLINKYLFIDNTFYNLQNIKIYNFLKSNQYVNILNINNKLKYFLYAFLHDINNKITYLYHKNINYLQFIKNFIMAYNYKKSILFQFNELNLISDKFNNSSTSNYILINLINCKNNIYKFINIIQDNLIKLNKNYNLLLLSNNNNHNNNNNNNLITYFTFSNLIYV